jgi:hypothetical protein
MPIKHFSSYLVLDLRTGALATRKNKPTEVAINSMVLRLDLNLNIPDTIIPTVTATITPSTETLNKIVITELEG